MIKTPFYKYGVLFFSIAVLFSGCTLPPPVENPETQQTQFAQKIDDWSFAPIDAEYDRASGGMQTTGLPMAYKSMNASGAPNIGLSVGGAKDINNFRENIKNGFLPLPTDITYEGLFYGYYFDTGAQEQCSKLFCPSYSTAVSADPLSKENEYYLSVGLNSGIKESDFKRKKLNLIIVMDISGSMGSPFNQYYYDRFGNRMELEKEEVGAKKIEIAAKSITAMMDHLNPDDRFGVVLFDDIAFLAKPMTRVGDTDMKAIKDHILELGERNGTNMDAGMQEATKLFSELKETDPSIYENRIVFMTDAQPNLGETSEEGMFKMFKDNAGNKIYTTFVGIGVDFNTELIESLTKIRGANYYSVYSAKEFQKVLDTDFDYMVTPLVFDLSLKLEATGWAIEKVYGSPEASESTGEIMKVNTLFPSKTEGGETKGGLVLIKLKKTGEGGNMKLKVSYQDRNGKPDSEEKDIVFADKSADFYDNTGIHKGILLTRYANLMQGFAADSRLQTNKPDFHVTCPYIITYEKGMVCPMNRCMPPLPPPCHFELGQWERQSIDLSVSSHYKKIFADFAKYFEAEMKAIDDDMLKQELDVLNKLEAE